MLTTLGIKMPLDKTWMNERGGAKYIEGVRQFANFVKENADGQVLFTCPCCRCKNSKGHINLDEISLHLLQHGIDKSYVVWVHHGEKSKELVGQRPTDEIGYPRMDELVADVYDVHIGDVDDESVDVNTIREEDQGVDPAVDIDTTLWRLANGPMHRATSIKKYRVNGFIFSSSSSDECLVTQDSGVSMEAYASFVASRKDKNPKEGMMTYYGIVRDILELDYIDFKETVLYCDWVKVEDSKNGCKVDPIWNHVMVNLKKLKNKEKVEEDPFILAREASGVFYSKDQRNDGWHAVLHTPKRLSKQIDMVDIPSDYQSILKDNPSLRSLLTFDD